MITLRQLAGRRRRLKPPPQKQSNTVSTSEARELSGASVTVLRSVPPPQDGRVPESVLVAGNQAYGTSGTLALPPPPEAPPPPYPGGDNDDGLHKVKSVHEYDYIQNNRTYTTAL